MIEKKNNFFILDKEDEIDYGINYIIFNMETEKYIKIGKLYEENMNIFDGPLPPIIKETNLSDKNWESFAYQNKTDLLSNINKINKSRVLTSISMFINNTEKLLIVYNPQKKFKTI
jgi:hypothetical protein